MHDVRSPMYDDRERFPRRPIHLDSALVMLGGRAEWHGIDSTCSRQTLELRVKRDLRELIR